jgi:hypothetical protein
MGHPRGKVRLRRRMFGAPAYRSRLEISPYVTEENCIKAIRYGFAPASSLISPGLSRGGTVKETRPKDAASPPSIEISGTVQKIIPASCDAPELAQIFIACGDGSYAEIRVKNSLQDSQGRPVALLKGAHVEISVKPDRRSKTARDLHS